VGRHVCVIPNSDTAIGGELLVNAEVEPVWEADFVAHEKRSQFNQCADALLCGSVDVQAVRRELAGESLNGFGAGSGRLHEILTGNEQLLGERSLAAHGHFERLV
jgi:hypothetical protein